MNRILMTATIFAICVPAAGAADLIDLYDLGAQYDPAVRVAQSTLESARMNRPIAKAQLLPNLSADADFNWRNENADRPLTGSNSDDFTDHRAGLNLTQPLYRRDRWYQLEQADSIVAQAEADYDAVIQGLIDRVTTRYFAVLEAQDNLGFAESERKAIERELDQAKQRFEVGLIAITDVHETQARYDGSRSRVIRDRNLLDNAWEALREIVGPGIPNELSKLKEEIDLEPPTPDSIDRWSEIALQNNPVVESARQAAEAARQEIEVQRSGHYPSLDLVGRYARDRSNADTGIDLDSTVLGVQLAVPIYSGGGVSAVTKQARYDFEAAQRVLDQQRRAVDKNVRDFFRGVESSISQVEALKATIVSAQSALDATTAGFDVGTRTLVDVLNSQRDMFDAMRTYTIARYEYVLNLVALQRAAGSLDKEDIERVNEWLEE